MADSGAIEANHESTATGNMVLVVSQDGSICSVLETPGSLRTSQRIALTTASIDDIWPRALTDALRANIKRTIRNRQFHSDEAENPADGTNSEFIYVPHGRDRVLLVVRDITESKEALTRIRQLAYSDEVTGLPNREYLLHELQRITDIQRLREGRAAVLCIHVDQFGDDGNALIAGHEDELIKELASRMEMHLRGMNDARRDDIERYSIVARTNFRQFSVVLPSIECGEDAESVMMRLLGVLTQPVPLDMRTITVTANGGVALFPQDGTDPSALYSNATAAMEDARNSMSTSFRFHSGTVRLRNLQRQDLAADLKTALQRQDFTLNYLPIVDAQTGSIHCVEALLRWPETILGARSTRKIITIAEYTGLIVEIGEWVLRCACEQLRALREAGHEDMRVAVNLSGQEFSHAHLAERVEAVLKDTEVEPACLDLEIKEHMVYRDAMQKHARCKHLKSIGVGVVIDDYGTGGCTLAHLSQSPVDTIKIDMSFVANIESSDRDRAACAAAIALAHGLGMRVIAEGVETEYQAQFLREKGCDLLQGFLFCEPLPSDELISYLDDSARTGSAEAFGSWRT
jgi:diguanylate cyclase (GGDEF)-like protein